jgi:hypothetical protein
VESPHWRLETVCIAQAGCIMSVVLGRSIVPTFFSRIRGHSGKKTLDEFSQRKDLRLRDNQGVVLWYHFCSPTETIANFCSYRENRKRNFGGLRHNCFPSGRPISIPRVLALSAWYFFPPIPSTTEHVPTATTSSTTRHQQVQAA